MGSEAFPVMCSPQRYRLCQIQLQIGKCLLDLRRERGCYREGCSVIITESKGSKWGHYVDLASQASLRKISSLYFHKGMV